MCEVAHGFEMVVGRFFIRADDGENLLSELVDDFRMCAEFVEEPGEGASGGIAAGEEYGDELVAEDRAVACVASESVQKGEAFVRLGLLLEFVLRESESLQGEVSKMHVVRMIDHAYLIDESASELVQDPDSLVEALSRNQNVHGTSASDNGLHPLSLRKRQSEFCFAILQATHAATE